MFSGVSGRNYGWHSVPPEMYFMYKWYISQRDDATIKKYNKINNKTDSSGQREAMATPNGLGQPPLTLPVIPISPARIARHLRVHTHPLVDHELDLTPKWRIRCS
jgi:hypothetical protein